MKYGQIMIDKDRHPDRIKDSKESVLALVVECEKNEKAPSGKYYITVKDDLMKKLILRTLGDELVRLVPNKYTEANRDLNRNIVDSIIQAIKDVKFLTVDKVSWTIVKSHGT